MIKKIRYLIEAAIVKLSLWFFEILGPQKASDSGSFLARLIGKRHPTHKLAMQNISKALPNLSAQEKVKTGPFNELDSQKRHDLRCG